jgi:antitoxin component HigA of HigAB toxin-antitoxin module
MEIRPIKTGADYAAAVAEVERLMDAAPGTPVQQSPRVGSRADNWYPRAHRVHEW